MANGTSILPKESQPPPLANAPYTGVPPPTAPGTYPPSPHGQTHISSDLVPVVTTSSPGLAPQLSGNPNTWMNGNGAFTTPPGTPLNLRGTVSTYSALPSTGNALNDFWVTLDTGHGWAWNGTAWVDMGPFQGSPGPAGPAGGAGPQGPAGPAGQGYTWLGAWNSGTAYVPYQTVSYQGSSYVCIAANTNQLPTNTTYWNIIAQTGQPGSAGATGPAGPSGTPGAAGPTGPSGQPAYSLTTAQVTIPAAGTTATVTLSDVSWANIGDYVSVAGAAGSGQSAVLQITAIDTTNKILTLLNPPQGGGIPPASNSQAGLMNTLSGNGGDYVGGDNACHNLVTAIQPTIWSMRLRSFNAIGNPTFEIDARTVGVGITAPTTITFAQDRWQFLKAGGTTMAASAKQTAGGVFLPGTNFLVSTYFLRTTLTAAQATLGTGDALWLNQLVEGPQLRELLGDVHSVSLLVRSSVAGLTFGLTLRDQSASRSLTKLCTIPTANTWTLIPLPNLPIWAAGGNFPLGAGGVGYQLSMVLAAGTGLITPANDTWQTGNFMAAIGQANFAAQAVNSTFDVAFVQHEPGALCTTLIDKPFTQNYDECLRYWCKSYPYVGVLGGNTGQACVNFTVFSGGFTTLPSGYASFPKELAKSPTMTIYASGGAINNVFDNQAGTNRTVSSTVSTTRYLSQITIGTASAAGNIIQFNYAADTGW